MSTDWQTWIAFGIVGLTVLVVLWRVFRRRGRKSAGDGCGCGSAACESPAKPRPRTGH